MLHLEQNLLKTHDLLRTWKHLSLSEVCQASKGVVFGLCGMSILPPLPLLSF